ncbi:hypothetical protein SCUCBS95973_004437 [Sporothrix curviconia]|uniref:Zn(2)-C6 fungal-type domain-containing protein n=1 Tax=Sporothrix curviconia TaxID=1260050 RepID=A0ABP0BQE4_9PEZI
MATFQFSVAPQSGAQSQRSQRRGKVKTGCGTCRTRKVKCDEAKPLCQKCVSTGRTCDGYASPFRFYGGDASSSAPAPPASIAASKATAGPGASVATSAEVSQDDIANLQRCFSTKTLFEYVTLGCDDEARQVLQASLTDPAIRHAVSSLRALRDDLETACPLQPPATSAAPRSRLLSAASSGASSPQAYSPACMISSVSSYASVEPSSPAYGYGLQQYCLALGGLASTLSSVDSSKPGAANANSSTTDRNGIRSALLCCQVFISIEQVRSNFAAMAQHIIQGLRILYEHRERQRERPLASEEEPLPALDVFIIKLFAAPCKFTDVPPAGTVDSDAVSVSTSSTPDSSTAATARMRAIAPDMRTELTRLSASALSYLAKAAVATPGDAANEHRLVAEQKALMGSLDAWLLKLERLQLARGPRTELLSITFQRFFHRLLRVVLLSTQRGNKSAAEVLAPEYAELQIIGTVLGERMKTYWAQGEGGGHESPEV